MRQRCPPPNLCADARLVWRTVVRQQQRVRYHHSDLIAGYAEELHKRLSVQLDLEGRDYLIEKMRKSHADDVAPAEGNYAI